MMRLPPRPSLSLDTNPVVWQRRALRYLAIYLVLALSLVALRYTTQHIRPALRDAQKQESDLLTQRDDLRIKVQVATTPQKIEDWALAHGMQQFAYVHKTTRDLGKAPALNTPTSAPALEVITKWK